jgi:predicted metalloenzyme YecM
MPFESEFYGAGDKFLEHLFSSLKALSVSFPKNWDVDHICFRAGSMTSYQQSCQHLGGIGTLLTESEVHGRPIATFKLKKPFVVRDQIIDIVEVPAPKGSDGFKDGFEHVEIVVDIPLPEVKQWLEGYGLPSSQSAKSLNAELKVSLPGGNLKFHALSLESLIRLEQSPAYPALKASQILETLSPFSPLVAGTFPLGLQTKDSDLDLILTMTDKQNLRSVLAENYGHCRGFTLKESEVQGLPTLICRFDFDQVPFEVFAQSVPSMQQRGYRHFQTEERLLKLGGSSFCQRLRHLRSQGFKTEPAFSQILGLHGDPYEALLALHSMSLKELSQMAKFK